MSDSIPPQVSASTIPIRWEDYITFSSELSEPAVEKYRGMLNNFAATPIGQQVLWQIKKRIEDPTQLIYGQKIEVASNTDGDGFQYGEFDNQPPKILVQESDLGKAAFIDSTYTAAYSLSQEASFIHELGHAADRKMTDYTIALDDLGSQFKEIGFTYNDNKSLTIDQDSDFFKSLSPKQKEALLLDPRVTGDSPPPNHMLRANEKPFALLDDDALALMRLNPQFEELHQEHQKLVALREEIENHAVNVENIYRMQTQQNPKLRGTYLADVSLLPPADLFGGTVQVHKLQACITPELLNSARLIDIKWTEKYGSPVKQMTLEDIPYLKDMVDSKGIFLDMPPKDNPPLAFDPVDIPDGTTVAPEAVAITSPAAQDKGRGA